MRVIILGVVPPPRGGVSTHVERLLPYLDDAGIKWVVLDHSPVEKDAAGVVSMRKRPLAALAAIWKFRGGVLHYPLTSVTIGRTVFLLLLRLFGIRLTLTLVGGPGQTLAGNPGKERLMKLIAGWSRQVVANNESFCQWLVENGIDRDKVQRIQAFIPYKAVPGDFERIPKGVIDFCEKRDPVITTYVVGPVFHEGADLYGLDIFVEAAAEVAAGHPEAGFLVIIPDVTEKAYFDSILERIEELGLTDHFHFGHGGQFPFVPILERSGIFVRATNTDGDPLTLREAEYAGVPMAASDATGRPPSARVFRNRDEKDLARVVLEILAAGKRGEVSPESTVNNAFLYMDVLNRAASKGKNRA